MTGNPLDPGGLLSSSTFLYIGSRGSVELRGTLILPWHNLYIVILHYIFERDILKREMKENSDVPNYKHFEPDCHMPNESDLERLANGRHPNVKLEITIQELWDLHRYAKENDMDEYHLYELIVELHTKKRLNMAILHVFEELRFSNSKKVQKTLKNLVEYMYEEIPYPLDEDFDKLGKTLNKYVTPK